uniref:Uncharacterized protein n=1 Tax=Micrurus paraensis TaxID=1970185 RepID=A0A2D4KSI2_9SAUR
MVETQRALLSQFLHNFKILSPFFQSANHFENGTVRNGIYNSAKNACRIASLAVAGVRGGGQKRQLYSSSTIKTPTPSSMHMTSSHAQKGWNFNCTVATAILPLLTTSCPHRCQGSLQPKVYSV